MTGKRWIYALDDPLPGDVSPAALLGGKGLSLRRMAEAGLTVPSGFTITTEACRAALAADMIWPEGLEEQLAESLHDLQNVIRGKSSGELRLAVRSGAEVSMPGILETVLDCESSMAELHSAVRSVFNSWHSERALAWRARQQIDDSAGTAVTVQQFVETVCSGVLFTKSPQSESDRNDSDEPTMLVEIVRGRGDALVSGKATPQVFTVDRRLQCEASVCPVADEPEKALAEAGITRSQLLSLARTGLDLEKQFGEPLDIEWGLTEAGFVFFQSRPVPCRLRPAAAETDSSVSQSTVDRFRDTEIDRLCALLNNGRVLVRHNLAESLPAPTPMTWTIVRRMMSGAGGLGRLYRMLGYSPGRQVCSEGFLELVAGRPFADPDRLVQLFATEWPLCHDYDSLKTEPHRLHEPPRHFDPDRTHPLLLLMLPHLSFVALRSARRIQSLLKTADSRFRVALSAWSAWVDEEKKRELNECSRENLVQIFEERVRQTVDIFAADSLLPGTVGAIAASELHRRVTQRASSDLADSLQAELLGSVSDPLIKRQSTLLQSAAEDEDVLAQFLAEFGHRGPGEMELSNPRWNERLLDAREVGGTPRHKSKSEPVSDLPSLFEKAGLKSQNELVRLAETAQRLLPFREAGRHELMRGFALIREVLQELAQRTDLGKDIYFLETRELMALRSADSVQQTIDRRRAEFDAAKQLSVPDYVDVDSLNEIGGETGRLAAEQGEEFQGTVLSRGQCVGPVVRLAATDSATSIPPGAVIVADSLDPALVPAMLHAGGVIVEQGGVLSHGAVVARQLGVPVLRCAAAARSLVDGQTVSIDSEECRVTLVNPVAPD